MKVKSHDVKHLTQATFPEYTGRKFSVEAVETVTLFDLNWSGGTRNQYRACTIDGQPMQSADAYNQVAPWANPAEGLRVPVLPNGVIVEHSIFCGKDCGLTFYVHPSNMPRLLNA